MEAIGALPIRTRVKRRKAGPVGESAPSDKARYPCNCVPVLVTGRQRSLLALPSEICRAPARVGPRTKDGGPWPGRSRRAA